MKINKILAIATILSIITAIISGCFPKATINDANNTNKNTEPSTITDNISVDIGSPIQLNREDIPNSYNAVVNDYITINSKESDIIIPNQIAFTKVTANKNTFTDYDKIKDIFITGDIKVEEIQTEDGAKICYYTTPDGTQLSTLSNNIVYRVADSFGDYSEALSYGGSIISPYLDDYYTKTELDGIDKEQAINIVREKLDLLGIEYCREPQVYCIDYDSFIAVSNKFYSLSDNVKEFDKDDEAYVVVFNLGFNDMPISYDTCTTDDGLYHESFATYGVVSKKGLVYLYTTAGYTQTSAEQSTQNLYNIDVIEKSLKNYYNGVKLKKHTTLGSQILLKYICVNGKIGMNEGLEFEPYWICHGVTHFEDDNIDIPVCVYVNALTGEVLDTTTISSIVM